MKLRWLCATALLSASSLLAQQASDIPKTTATGSKDTPAGKNVATFKTKSQLVLVPVVITDNGRKHVAGLAKNAFRLQEDGKVRDIAVFEEVLPQHNSASATAPNPEVASNFPVGSARPNHFTIIVLDIINTPYLKQMEGRRQLIEILSKGLEQNEPVTLLGLGGRGLVQLHSFTTDTGVLIAALQKLNGAITSGEMSDAEASQQSNQNADLMSSTGDAAQQISQFLQDSIDMMAALQQRDSTRRTLDALKQLAQAYSGDHARKTLIWASAGFPFMINDPHAFAHMGTDMVEQYEQTWRALTSANIAVYPVELVGLDSRKVDASQSRQSYQPGRSRHGNPMGTSATLAYNEQNQRQETLRAFADATGGRPCLNSNDFKKCFADAVEDSQSYYLLGYYLPSSEVKPGWRKLKVRVDARDTHVRAREGFYVTPSHEDTLAARHDELVTALSSPFEYTGIVLDVRSASVKGLEAKSGTVTSEPRKVMQDFIVHVPSSSILIDAENKNQVNLEIAAIALDRNGKDVSRFSQNVQVSFNPEMLARIMTTGIGLKEQLELIPGTYDCRFVVRDNQSGQIGTVHMSFKEQ